MNPGQPPSVNMKRLRVLTHGPPAIHDTNWSDLSVLGWHWQTNIKLTDYAAAVEAIKELQKTHGRENVTVGYEFNRELHKPISGTEFVGIYIKDIKKLVFALHRDMAKWERLTRRELEDL